MKKAFFILTFLVLAVSLQSCGESSRMATFKASSMSACLEGIKQHSGSNIKRMGTDTPKKVSGLLENGDTFGCDLMRTGSQGLYYEGWWIYDAKE